MNTKMQIFPLSALHIIDFDEFQAKVGRFFETNILSNHTPMLS